MYGISWGDRESLTDYKRYEYRKEFFEIVIARYIPNDPTYEIISRSGKKTKIRSGKNFNINIIRINSGIDAMDILTEEYNNLIDQYEEDPNWDLVSDYNNANNYDDEDPYKLYNLR